MATVAFVADGDTVRLEDGRWVRFIGLNTPERGKDGRPHEPLAEQARLRLRELLAGQGMQIQLRHGRDARDKYRRLLAHPFLPDGQNLTELMIREGLGFHIVVPPNQWSLDCYQQAEHQARNEKKGIWGHPWYAPKDSRTLPKNARGFMRIRGKVVRLGRSKKASWINLEGRVALKLAHKDKHRFAHLNLGRLVGKTITARGWFYPSNSRHDDLRMNLSHPSALEYDLGSGTDKR